MDLEFTAAGVLHSAHLERGVKIASDQQTGSARGASQTHRTWTSPIADVQFRDAGHGQLELASIHGTGGVTLTRTKPARQRLRRALPHDGRRCDGHLRRRHVAD